MAKIKGKNTLPEKRVRSELHKKGYRFRLHPKNLPGRPDIVLPMYSVAIFVNGCFWHRHEGCKYTYMPKSREDFWQEKFRGNVERDRKNMEEISTVGWKVFIIWECETRTSEKLENRLAELENTMLL